MIFQKTQEGNRTILTSISMEEALALENKTDLVFESQQERETFQQALENRGESIEDTLHAFEIPDMPKKSKVTLNRDKIIDVLPFLDDEDIHEVIMSMVNEMEDSEYNGLDLEDILPFASTEDCDLLFQKALSAQGNIDIGSLAPFVSDAGLSAFVDEYIKGNYPNADVDELYPFLSSKDVKRLFKYYISNK